MKYMRSILATLIFNIFLVSIYAQGQQTGAIKGKVVDKITKQSLPGATIIINDSKSGTSADTSGNFVLNNISEGVYSITVSYVGYQERIINDVQIIRGKTNYLEIEIEEAATGLQEVTVKAFKFENVRSAPVSNYGFSREEISRNPGAQGDIFRAIGMLPGVSSSGGQFSAIAVRGQGTRDNVYMVDDIPVTEVSHLEGNSSGFNDPNGGRFSIFAPRVIDNAEFQGGGFEPQYGRRSASYLGLSIKEGNREDYTVDGQLDLMGITLNYDGPSYIIKNTSLFISARYQNFVPLENIVNRKDLGPPIYQDFIFKSTSQLVANNKLSIIAIQSPETFTRNVNNLKEDKELKSLTIANMVSSKIILGLNLRTLIDKNSYIKNVLYYTNSSFHNSFGNPYPLVDSTGNLLEGSVISYEPDVRKMKYSETKIGFRSVYTHRFQNCANISTGIDLDRIGMNNDRELKHPDTLFAFNSGDYRPNPLQYYRILAPAQVNASFDKSAYDASAYFNYSCLLFRKLSINAGIRYDYTGFASQHTISPRLSGSLSINETNSINFAAGIFYQDPVYSEIADQPANKKLKEEKVTQFIIGYRKYFTPDLKLTIEGWYKKLDDLIVRPIAFQVEQSNSGTGWANGIDINITKRLVENIHGQIGYSHMQSKRDNHDGSGEYNSDFSQPHQFNLLISYKPNSHWILSTKYRYATGKPTDKYIVHADIFNNPDFLRYSEEIIGHNQNRLPDFSSLDIRADYRFQFRKLNLTAFVDIVDILNRQLATGYCFNYLNGTSSYDGMSIFPTFGLKFQF